MGRSNGLSTVASSGLVPTSITHHHQASRWKSITGTTSRARTPQPRKRLPSAKELASATTNDAPPCSPSMVRVMLRLLVAAALGSAASDCGLTDPTRLNAFTLVRVNGSPLPYTFGTARGLVDNRLYESRWIRGAVELFGGGRMVFDATNDVLVDGLPSPTLPPFTAHQVGEYSRTDSTLQFPPYFTGRILNGGRTLLLQDQSGGYDDAIFEFARR
jgi:hypothetical protein